MLLILWQIRVLLLFSNPRLHPKAELPKNIFHLQSRFAKVQDLLDPYAVAALSPIGC